MWGGALWAVSGPDLRATTMGTLSGGEWDDCSAGYQKKTKMLGKWIHHLERNYGGWGDQSTAGGKLPGPIVNGTHKRVLGMTMPLKVRTKGNVCFVPMTLLNSKSGTHVKTRALLNSGCSWGLVSPILVLGMGLATTKCLKETLMVEQMDSSLMGGCACDSKTKNVPMGWKNIES